MASAGEKNLIKIIEFYCPVHKKTFLTPDYILHHRKCTNVRPVHQVAKELQESGSLEELRGQLEKYNHQADTLLKDRNVEKDCLEKKKKNVLDEMATYRNNLCASLTDLESGVIKQISESYKKPLEQMNTQTERCQRLVKAVKNADAYLMELDRDGSDAQYIRAVLTIQKRCLFYEDVIKKEYDSLKNYTYAFVPNEKAKESASAIVSLGNIMCVRGTSKVTGFYSDTVRVSHSECKIKIVFAFDARCHTDEHKPSVTGACYLPKSRVFLVDRSNNTVKLYDEDGLLQGKLKFDESPWDVTSFDNDTVAVTFPASKLIRFIKQEPKIMIEETKQMDVGCWGISYDNGSFVVTCDPWTSSACVKLLSRECEVKSTLSIDEEGKPFFKAPLYATTRKRSSEFIISDAGTSKVVCMREDGCRIFTYGHVELKYPAGVTTDHQNNIYVCGRSSKNLHQLTHDGKLIRILLSSKDLTSPHALSAQYHGDKMVLIDSGHDSIGVKIIQFL